MPRTPLRSLARAAVPAVALLAAGTLSAPAQMDCARDAMIVFDGSGSMAEMGFNMIDEPRIFEARRAVADAIPRLPRRDGWA